MMRRLSRVIAVVALCLAPASLSAQETGSANQGQELAQTVCAACHAVEHGQTASPNMIAPTFDELAATPGMTATALSAALRTPHHSMPDLILKSDEIGNLTAYILSLKKP